MYQVPARYVKSGHYIPYMLSQLTILFYKKAMMTELSVVLEMFSVCAGQSIATGHLCWPLALKHRQYIENLKMLYC